MSFKGFICHVTGLTVTPEECLSCSLAGGLQDSESGQWCPFTPPIVRGLIESNVPRGLLAYSATELLGCPRKVVLREQEDFWVKPNQAYWAFRGKLAHSIVELGHQDPDVVLEERFYADLAGMVVTGQVDLLYTAKRHLVDYKTTKQVPQNLKRYTCPACGSLLRETQWAYKKGSTVQCGACGAVHNANDLQAQVTPPHPYDGHVQQLNIYRWLLAQNNIPVATAEVIYLDMSEPLRLPVPLWDLRDTEDFLFDRLRAIQERGLDGLPEGVWGNPDEEWQCNYCPVKAVCIAYRDLAEQALHQLITAMVASNLVEETVAAVPAVIDY